MKALLSRIHAKLGDLWWYAILLFVVQRFGDVINMFVGLWIVPKYVPMEELGAVLPLTNVVSLIGIPLAVVSTPFLKFVAVFAEKRELGKAKALIRDAFIGTGIFGLLSILVAYFILPFFFERLRVPNGCLALLLLVVTVLTAVSNISLNAVSALKMFSQTVWYSTIAAPLRLLMMVALMPFRALSGYVVGGAAVPIVNIVGPLLALRKFFKSGIKSEPYWHEYGRSILMYTWPLVVMTALGAVSGNLDMLVIRHRLCDFESAGYYMITRFSDIAMQIGAAFTAFLLPMLAGKDGNDSESRKLAFQSLFGVMGVGLLLTAALHLFGGSLLRLKSEWATYAPLAPQMTAMSLNSTLAMTTSCLTSVFIARGRFAFLWYCLGIGLGKSVLVYALCGITFFQGILPQGWIDAVLSFNPCRLTFVIEANLAVSALTLILLCIHVFGWHRKF